MPTRPVSTAAPSLPPVLPEPAPNPAAPPTEPEELTPGELAGELPPDESDTSPWPVGGTLTDPIDQRFLTDLPFGTSSFWVQPWRAYLDTWPASRLLEAVGVNFNVWPKEAEDTAQLLADSGFRLARVGVGWNAMSYDEPGALRAANEASVAARLTALHRHGLRPLLILDANSGDPAPSTSVTLTTTATAAAGSRTVTLTQASAAEVVPGRTGFNDLTPFHGGPDVLITAVDADGVATLARPLPAALAAGEHRGTTLRYAPFEAPLLADGAPNPAFGATLAGWLKYVGAVCRLAASVVGPGGYDVEIWNELSFGSQFLNAENYYSSASEGGAGSESEATEGASRSETGGEPPSGSGEAEGPSDAGAEATGATQEGSARSKREVNQEIVKTLLAETVDYVRDPAHGISPAVGITDGFASETPFPSGAKAPLGLTALSKHPYAGARTFPVSYEPNGIRPVNAVGLRDTRPKERAPYNPLFIPSYLSDFPEYTLTPTSTETLVRDLAPFTTEVYGFPHGRQVGPAGGVPVQKWVTEYNLGSANTTPVGPDGVTPQTGPAAQLTHADKAHFEAKALLRSLTAMVSKGVGREYFYAAGGAGDLSMIAEGFMSAVRSEPAVYPGDRLGGEVMSGFRNMLARFQGPGPGPEGARQLQLLAIAQDGNHAQFAGDGSAAHPSLYDRDVLAVFPFQSSPTRFVIPVYVMTRNLLTLYEPGQPTSDLQRLDLPDETFQITLGNLPETPDPPVVSAYDPLRDEATPARLVSRSGSSAVFELAATDYPRILTVEYG